MLYKVFMQEAFREDSDLVGFIQATNVEDAVDILAVKVGSDWADDRLPKFTRVTVNVQQGRLEAQSTDEDGNSGRDVYVIQSFRSDIALFHGKDWQALFKE